MRYRVSARSASDRRLGLSRSARLPDVTKILTGGAVFTGGSEPLVIEGGAVAFKRDRIVAVGPASEVIDAQRGAEVIDVSGKLIMPGFINAHTHLYSALARGLMVDIAPSANFVEILEHLWWKLDRALTHEDTWYSAAVGALDLVRSGTTTIVDHHASQENITDSMANVVDALKEIGIRANLCFEISDRNGETKREEGLAESEALISELAAAAEASASAIGGDGTGLLTASVGLHASFTVSDGTLDRAAGIAGDAGVGCHIHVAEDQADVDDSLRRAGKRVVERLNEHGILGRRTIAAHCIHINEHERDILIDTGTIVVHNAQSNMNNAVGCADIPGMLKAGILVGLGTDGFTGSMFDEMKVANLIHRHEAGDPRVGHDVAERLCLRNNGVIGSRLVNGTVGELSVGALADIIVLDYDPPTPLEAANFAGHVIFGLTGWMVETVIIGGREIMRDREFTTVDARGTAARARELARDLWGRM